MAAPLWRRSGHPALSRTGYVARNDQLPTRLRQSLKITCPKKLAWEFKAPLDWWPNVRAWALLAVVLPGQSLRIQCGARRPFHLAFQTTGGNRQLFHSSKITAKNTVACIIGNCRMYCEDSAKKYARLVRDTFNRNYVEYAILAAYIQFYTL